MTLICLGLNDDGKLGLVADKLIGDGIRKYDHRRKISKTPSGNLFGISGDNFAVCRMRLATHIDNNTVSEYMEVLLAHGEEVGVIIIDGSNVETYHVCPNGKGKVMYANIMSTGSMMGTGDLFWVVRDLYEDGHIPKISDLVARMNLIHLLIGDSRPVDVMISDHSYETIDEYEKWALKDF